MLLSLRYRGMRHLLICLLTFLFFCFFQEVVTAPVSNNKEEKVKQIMVIQIQKETLLHSKFNENLLFSIAEGPVSSRGAEGEGQAAIGTGP